MIRQLGVDERHIDLALARFLDAETAHLHKTVVVILDQFEEFFLRFPPEVRQRFQQELGACLATPLDVHFLIALREDYFAALAEFLPTIPDLFTHAMRLTRLTPAQALAAAIEPVRVCGMTIDATLMEEVILPQLDEAGQGIAPPLLQIVCHGLYEHAQNAGRSTIGQEEYVALGDIRTVLEQYLDDTLRPFGPEQPQARAVLKALATAEGTKRASFAEEIVARAQQAQQRLAALYTEQGRQELLQGSPLKAVMYLSEAYQGGETGPTLRLLLADAMRPIDAQLASLEGHTDLVWAAQFSPDGTRVVTASKDKTAQVWEVASGRLLASLTGYTDSVQAAQFSADGTRVVTVSFDKTAQVWDVHLETRSPAEIAALVRCRAPWRLDEGRLLPTTPDATACPQRSPAR